MSGWREVTPEEEAQWEADATDPDSGYILHAVVHRPAKTPRSSMFACGQTHTGEPWWVPGRIVRAEGFSKCLRSGCRDG